MLCFVLIDCVVHCAASLFTLAHAPFPLPLSKKSYCVTVFSLEM